MGINPMGSNKKARTTLVFSREIELTEFKNAISDVAETRSTSPSEAVLALVLEHIAATPKARDMARTMYSSENPRCLEGLEVIFEELAAIGERGRDSEPIVRSFLELTLSLGLRIDTTDDDAIYIREQWNSIVDVLDNASKDDEFEAALATRNAKQLGSALEAPSAMQAISSMLSCLLENWKMLRNQSCTYRALCCLTRMAFPTRRGVEETATTRLTFLRATDDFYASGKESG